MAEIKYIISHIVMLHQQTPFTYCNMRDKLNLLQLLQLLNVINIYQIQKKTIYLENAMYT